MNPMTFMNAINSIAMRLKPTIAHRCFSSGPPPQIFSSKLLHTAPAAEPNNPASQENKPTTTPDRRTALLTILGVSVALNTAPSARAAVPEISTLDLERAAADAYSRRDFTSALKYIDELVLRDPTSPRLREMRATLLVDNKAFDLAIKDFNECLRLLDSRSSLTLDNARVMSGRALALEGLGAWEEALKDYSAALEIAQRLGADADPYLLNSKGNCHASLGEWKLAREDYLASANGFQSARREDRLSGRMQQRLDGAVFAFSNAALMLAQLGDDDNATKEMQSIARRAPGSADMRAALAAQLWSEGQEEEAESEWSFACSNITVGCSKYQDTEWLRKIRRWPPVMVDRLQAFIKMRSTAAGAGGDARQPTKRYSGFKE